MAFTVVAVARLIMAVDVGVRDCGITTTAITPTAIIATAVIVNCNRGW